MKSPTRRRLLVSVGLLSILAAVPLVADYVGSLVNRIFLDPASISVVSNGYQVGDVVSFILETTPADTGSDNGHAAWMTAYLPAGVRVVGADYVLPAANGGYDTIPAEDTDQTYDGWGSRGNRGWSAEAIGGVLVDEGFVNEVQQDTGIFYSTDSRTALVAAGVGVLDPTGVPAQTIYNQWDYDQLGVFGVGGATNGGQGNTPVFSTDGGTTWTGVGSIVAGPDSYYTNDYNPACSGSALFANDIQCAGPWNRIETPNDKIGAAGAIAPAAAQGPIQNTSVAASGGFTLDPSSFDCSTDTNCLPAATNTVRWVHGKRRLGELESARLTFVITDPIAFANSVNADEFCLDSTGGDTSDTAAKDNPFRYYEPQHECDFFASTAAFIKETKFVNGVPANGASLTVGDVLSWRILFINTSGDPVSMPPTGETLTNVRISDIPVAGDLLLLEPGDPLCAYPSYDGNQTGGPIYDAGSATTEPATWTSSLAPPPGVDVPAGQSLEVFMCGVVNSGGVNDRFENEATVLYDSLTATDITLTSKAGGTISNSISGHVYNDVDLSGTLTVGDAGVGGVQVDLYLDDGTTPGVLDASDTLVDTKFTLSDGSYEFAGLAADDFLVVETDLASWTSTGDKDDPGGPCPGGGNGCNVIGTITTGGGGASLLNDFFDQAPASALNVIEGLVFFDNNVNATFDVGDTESPGVDARLYRDSNGNGMIDLGEPLLQTVTVAADGTYSFVTTETGDFVVDVDPSTFPLGSSLTTGNAAGEAINFVGTGNTSSGHDFGLYGGVGTTGGICYAVADSVDQLVAVDFTGGPPVFVDIGPTGTTTLEAMAIQPGTHRLFGATASQLGTMNPNTGVFTPVGGVYGTCTLPGPATTTVNDVDGLTFDPFTGVLWASERDGGDDILLQLDPATGTVVPNSFGPGISCLRIPTSAAPGGRVDLDDIAIDPSFITMGGLPRGELYAISNSGGVQDRLIRINKVTGAVTDIGLLGVGDMEGLGFGNDGTLYGTTGGGASLYTILKLPPPTPALQLAFPSYGDYEAVDCQTAGSNSVRGTVFVDFDQDAVFEPATGEAGTGGVLVRLYIDSNNDGVVDGGDVLIQTLATNPDGSYAFPIAATGNYVVDTVFPASYPPSSTLTTDNVEQADFTAFNQVDAGNDFGFIAPSDLAITKASNAVGEVVPGQSIQYTITVTNNGAVNQTGIRIFDPLPAGTGYVAESTTATGFIPGTPVEVAGATFQPGCSGDNYPFGTGVWVGGWQEIGETTDCNSNDVRVRGDGGGGNNAIRIDNDNGVYRDVNLSAYFTAFLDLQFRRRNLNSADDITRIAVCDVTVSACTSTAAVGTAGWVLLEQIQGPNNDVTYQSRSYDISAFRSAQTRIRVLNAPTHNRDIFFDNFALRGSSLTATTLDNDPATAGIAPLTSGNPPDLVLLADGFILEPAATMTVTFSVTVDDPLDPYRAAIVNLATVSTNQAVPAQASVVDPVSSLGTIGDRVWLDLDGDGVQDIGEPGIANVEVTLYEAGADMMIGGGDDVAVGTLITGINGKYLFEHLVPGNYYVDVTDATVPSGLAIAPGSTDPSAVVAITDKEVFLSLDFGYRNASSGTAILGDRVWSDFDNDGIQDPGEAGIDNVTLWLRGLGPDGILGTGDDTTEQTVSTGPDGTYLFTNVTPGEYRVEVDETSPALTGYSLTVGPQSSLNPSLPVTVAAGDMISDIDFGYRNPATFRISDRFWHDLDADGGQDPGEPGIANVTVSLFDASGDVVATAISDASGDFTFSGLPNGSYSISATDSSGELVAFGGTTTAGQTGQHAVTVAGADVSGVNFGYSAPGTIGDTIFSDADGNGVQDPGEPGIDGVTVQLWRDADGNGLFDNTVDTLVDSQVTDASGYYQFRGLGPGTYFSSVDNGQAALAGYIPTTTDDELGPNAAGTQIEVTHTSPFQSTVDADFGYRNVALPDISGNVFEDLDADGLDDGAGEPGFFDVTLELVDAGPDGMFGTGDDLVVAMTTTDGNGDYSFADVAAGNYQVVVTDDALVLDGYNLTSGLDRRTITVAAADITGIDFGYNRTSGTASIGDTVWLDLDGNGTQEGGEPGIGNVEVELWLDNGDGVFDTGTDTLVTSQITDNQGNYRFEDLGPGNYFANVDETTLPGGVPASALARTDAMGSGSNSALINLSDGEYYQLADFGYGSGPGEGAVGDRVWYDANGDAQQDPGEPGIGGVTVRLYDITRTTVLATTMTAPDGTYLFTGLAPGDYAVVVDTTTVPAYYNATPTNTPGGRDFLEPPAVAGQVTAWADFGFDSAVPANESTIGDRIFLDQDGDGVEDAGEPGIEGVQVNLIDDVSGDIIATMTTDANGNYDFAVPPGTYTVVVNDVDAVLDKLNRTTSLAPTQGIAIVAGTNYDTADFGYSPAAGLGSIGDKVFTDFDLDGFRDPGEPGIQGVVVDLWQDTNGNGVLEKDGTDNYLRSVVTDQNGEYQFQGLPLDNYLVEVNVAKSSVLAGMTQTFGTPNTNDHGQVSPYPVSLTPGSPTSNTADFAYSATLPLQITGNTYFDNNGNGTIDPPFEQGVQGVTLLLYRDFDGDGVGDALIQTTTSDPNGDYVFANVPGSGDDLNPFNYVVVVDTTGSFLSGSLQTEPAAGNRTPALGTMNSNNNNFGFTLAPTLVLISGLESYLDGDAVVVELETVSQLGSIGFWLWRWDAELGDYVQVNDSILPATPAPRGAVYRFVDPGASVDGNRYVVFEGEMRGGERVYGPFEVAVGETGPSLENRPLLITERAPDAALSSRAATALAESRSHFGNNYGVTVEENAKKGASAVKVYTADAGIQAVSARQIAESLGDKVSKIEKSIRSGKMRVEHYDNGWQEVAWTAPSDNTSIYFHAEPTATIYSDVNVYRIREKKGMTMVEASAGAPAPAASPVGFLSQVRFEEQVFAGTFASTSAETDFWYWEGLIADHPSFGTKDVPLDVADPTGEAAEMRVRLYGVSNTSAPTDHRVRLQLNGVDLGTTEWDAMAFHEVTVAIPAGTLVPGANTVTVSAELATGVAYSFVYLDRIDLSYPRHYRAASDRLELSSDSSAVVTIAGFSSPEIEVFEVSDPRRPVRLTDTTIDDANGYRVSFRPSGPNVAYRAVARPGLSPTATEPWIELDTKKLEKGAEYLVIAPEALGKGAQRLADYRDRQGLRSVVVGLQGIYNLYGGQSSPQSIARFVDQAWREWKRPPRYLTLIGKGSFDYNDYQGLGGNLLPPLMTETPLGLYAADGMFGDVEGSDGVPEIAVGRVPVLTSAELGTFVDKVIFYESSGGLAGEDRVVLLADDADMGGDFTASSEAMSLRIPLAFQQQKIYLDLETIDDARAEFFSSLSEGATLVNYIGHGGPDRVTAEGLLTESDLPLVAAEGRLPIIATMTCSLGRFELPGVVSLAEALVLSAESGAAAVFAPTGTSVNREAELLNQFFLDALFAPGRQRIGDAVVKALRDHADHGELPVVSKVYGLLGDPALEIEQ